MAKPHEANRAGHRRPGLQTVARQGLSGRIAGRGLVSRHRRIAVPALTPGRSVVLLSQKSAGAKAARRAFVLQGRFRRFFSNLGPGLITGAADDDPSGISTYSITGAAFGYAPLWTAMFSFPLMAAIQIMCARLGMVTGLGLASVIRRRYPRWILWSACALLVVANVVNIAADLGGMGCRHGASDWCQFALLDSRIRARPCCPAVLDQLSAHRPDFQVAHSRPVCLHRRRISGASGLARRAAGDPDSNCAVDRRVLGHAGRYSGNHHLAVPFLLAGRGGSGGGDLRGQDRPWNSAKARPIGNCGARGTMSSQACSFRTW